MNRKSLIATLALVLRLCPLSLSAEKTPTMAYPATFTSHQLLADFQVFQSALEEGHGGLYHFRSPTDSTTSDVCAFLHANSDAVFIGSETGGNYYGNTSGDSAVLTLPHTKLRVDIPLVRFDVNVAGYEPRDRGLVPNHQVSITPRSLVDGSNPVMEFALGLIRNTNVQQ